MDDSFEKSARRGSEARLDLIALLSLDAEGEGEGDDVSKKELLLVSSKVADHLEADEEEKKKRGYHPKEKKKKNSTSSCNDSDDHAAGDGSSDNRAGDGDDGHTTEAMVDSSFRKWAKIGTEARIGLIDSVFGHEGKETKGKGIETRIELIDSIFGHEEKEKGSSPDDHETAGDDGDGPVSSHSGREPLTPSDEPPPREPPLREAATTAEHEEGTMLPGAYSAGNPSNPRGSLVRNSQSGRNLLSRQLSDVSSGLMSLSSGDDDSTSVVDTGSHHHDHDESTPAGTAINDSASDTPVATEVLEDDHESAHFSIATATELQEMAPSTNGYSQSSNSFRDTSVYVRNTVALVVVLLLVCIIAIVLAILLVLERKNVTSSPPDGDHLRGTTKQQQSSSASILFWESLPNHTQHIIETDKVSPQFRAYRWLKEDPRFDNDDDDTPSYYTLERLQQRFALATIYFACGGIGWRKNHEWLSYETHECNWAFVAPSGYLYEVEHPEPGITAKYARVKSPCGSSISSTNNSTSIRENYHKLWLYNNNLRGTLPPETFLLTSLDSIILSGNAELEVSFSSQIGQLRQLELLEIGLTKFAGSLPSEIGRLTELRNIFLVGQRSSPRKLETTLPSEFGHLKKLERLYMSQIGLSGAIPSQIGTMDNLQHIHFSHNKLNGTIPEEFCRLTNLKAAILETNKLTGSIPTAIGQMIALEELWIFKNRLTGSIPSEFGNLPQLRRLWMYSNQLTGRIPTQVGRSRALEELFIEENNLWGLLPTEIGSLEKLSAMWVVNNDLTGGVPSELGMLSNLYDLNLGGNQLTGTIPQQLGLLAANASLTGLDLAGNAALTGTVPTHLCLLDGADKKFPDTIWWREEAFISFDCNDLLCGCDCAC